MSARDHVVSESIIARRECIISALPKSAAGILQGVEADARSAGVPVTSVHRIHPDPYRAILDVAKHDSCDLIVLASYPRITTSCSRVGCRGHTVEKTELMRRIRHHIPFAIETVEERPAAHERREVAFQGDHVMPPWSVRR